ncbi:hypothetical protein PFAG_05522 [Plasmodium falciparum Santa Lucia]|uniref:Uncharacterized protein n=7 Tax=Plasmodium falciparum TaxID=5833 RepID=W4IVP1_PLAFP|nr:hypothetical protein PFFVO_05059 [Plasmodium falciparum Vietnam Oak-Knoll (FVO)]ETW39834.1 hypothetical protein PFNF135_05862 [Plasmodium falciparum NF135/5.C10]ETW54088.1 hypothetical protein PFUGPA_03959 [Plasmodium falciparum Palo Alto/Uganda]ETW58394.1 hypothetical protein PFMC_05496 [Plasmodium falciparum CAMP/Malaysia]EUR62884.1 hypothetical protein PFBG_05489 [Plasmodium falciparum 7G8]EUT78946.1 hypothetical protein PFAG_05522 [Plasmodium falciparum Santa Lucia]EWC73803.1 hypotheti
MDHYLQMITSIYFINEHIVVNIIKKNKIIKQIVIIIPNKNSKFKDHFKIIHITNFKALYILYIFIYFN